ncbi:MAG: Gfo/Idh/MocA family oxidoreductase [Candidatus Rokubacteria bacterium]|nr:Gfo/Idh/MocA family oxidoreductase [Candidatus Rokubacteria bacterium]
MTAATVLLVGLGRWGEKHLRVLRELETDLWVADPIEARRAWAVRQGIPPERVVADYARVLPHVAAVDVVTPADTHRPIAEAALVAGRGCFVEKPIAGTVADARRLGEIARERRRVLQVGHIFRFHPVTATLRTALQAGRIGHVRFATGRFSGFKRPRTDVGVTHTDAIHYFDLFAHLFARPATRVSALQRDYLGRGLDDMSVTLVEYGDIDAIVEANYFVPGTHRECMIVGDAGSLVADFGRGTVTLHAGEHVRRNGGWDATSTTTEELAVEGQEPLRVELTAFLEACAGRGPNPVPADEALHALEIVEAAARGARSGRSVGLSEIASARPRPF